MMTTAVRVKGLTLSFICLAISFMLYLGGVLPGKLYWSISTIVHSFCPYGTKYVTDSLTSMAWEEWEKYTSSLDFCRYNNLSLSIPQYVEGDTYMKQYDLSQPLLFSGIMHDFSSQKRNLSIDGLMQPPLSELMVPFFSDARTQILTPDGEGLLGDLVYNITTNKDSFQKLGTQIPVDSFPELIKELAHPIFEVLLGDRFKPTDVRPLLGLFPALTTVSCYNTFL